jgi:hypothetical protein
VLAAAEQRLHAVTGGTWRDALLLAAWQRQQQQQQQQQQTLTNRLKGLQLEARDPLDVYSPLLDQVLTGPDAAAGLIAGTLTPAGTSSSGSGGGVSSSSDASSSRASSGQGRDSRTEFSLYWQPGKAWHRFGGCAHCWHTQCCLLVDTEVVCAAAVGLDPCVMLLICLMLAPLPKHLQAMHSCVKPAAWSQTDAQQHCCSRCLRTNPAPHPTHAAPTAPLHYHQKQPAAPAASSTRKVTGWACCTPTCHQQS